MLDETKRKLVIKDMKTKLILVVGFVCILIFLYFVFVSKFINKNDNAGIIAGNIAGDIGKGTGNFFSSFGSYVSNMGLVEWILLLIVGVGGFVVWHLKNKHDLKFSWSPKRPKKTFN